MKLRLEQVYYAYQEGGVSETPALHEINLEINSGELVTVIGHSGSGKSTLALLLAGLYQPSRGRVELSGAKSGEDPFRRVGMVFQYPEQQLFGETVFEEVAFGARNRGVPADYLPIKVRQALEDVGLDPDALWHRSPFSLSGGQKRRVCIAGMLAVQPELIILDEPGAGLDEGGRRWMTQLAHSWQEAGRGVVWITHDMAEAAELGGRNVVLNQGRILLDGTPESVFAQEEILRQAHLDIPPAAQLVRELRRQGWQLPARAVTVAQAADEVTAELERRQGRAADAAEAQPYAATPEADESHTDYDDEQWERQTAEQLRSLVAEEASDSSRPTRLPESKQPDYDLHDLTGQERERVRQWKGGGGCI